MVSSGSGQHPETGSLSAPFSLTLSSGLLETDYRSGL